MPEEYYNITHNFTPRAKEALTVARHEAERLNHNFIGPEHIALGLIKSRESMASRILVKFGVSLDSVQSEIERQMETGPYQRAEGIIHLTPSATEILTIAAREAEMMDHTHIGTEHILLGLLIKGGNGITRKSMRTGFSVEHFRDAIIRELNPCEETPPEKMKVGKYDIGPDTDNSWASLLSLASNSQTGLPADVFGELISTHALVLLAEYGPKVQPGSPILRSLDALLMHGLPCSETIMLFFCSAYKRLLGENARRHIETLFQKTAMGSKEETRIGQVLQTLTGARTVVRVTERDFLGLSPSSSATTTPVSATPPA